MRKAAFVIAVACFAACTSTNIVKDAPLKHVRAKHVLALEEDTSFCADLHQSLSGYEINIVADSVLLVKERTVNEEHPFYYKAYSLNDCSFLGEFVAKGRGPNEALSPKILGETSPGVAYVFDIRTSLSFELDIKASISSQKTVMSRISVLPENTLYSCPYSDSMQFAMRLEDNSIKGSLLDRRGNVINSYPIYRENIPVMQVLSQLSNFVEVNSDKGLVAMEMIGLPQINFMNLNDGQMYSSSTDKQSSNWRQIIMAAQNPEMLLEEKEYYIGSTRTEEYLLGLYANRCIRDVVEKLPMKPPHIHVFNWKGDLIFDLSIGENLSAIAYSSKGKYLYGLDADACKVYRYDVSDIK